MAAHQMIGAQRGQNGIPWALANSSVVIRPPSPTVASSIIARTAYSAFADIRME
jgi:hypothetical protein